MLVFLTMQGPAPLIQYWHSAVPPEDVGDLMATFRRHNPRRPYMAFSESSATGFLAERFSGREVDAFRSCAVPAMQADYFRYCAVLALGGAYCDADARCAGPLDALIDAAEGHLFRRPIGVVVNGFFSFRAPGHPFLALALEIATAQIEQRVSESVWAMTGPAIFTSLALIESLGSLDAYLEFCRERGRLWEPDLLCEVVGDRGRVTRALEDVRISPLAQMAEQIPALGQEAAYKLTDVHWVNWSSSIYR